MNTKTSDYRSHRSTVLWRLRERLARFEADVGHPSVRLRTAVHRHRVARSVAGAIGAIGGLAMLIVGVAGVAMDMSPTSALVASTMLFGTLSAVVASYLVAYVAAPVVERRRMAWLMRRSDDPERDLAILERASARSVATEAAERWEGASLALPLAAVALVGPLTLHTIFFVFDGGLRGYGQWIQISAMVVGHAHLVFAGLALRYVSQLRRGALPSHPLARTWGWVTLTAAIPGVLMFGLPPVITGVTGLFLIYPAFKWAEVALGRERLVLAS